MSRGNRDKPWPETKAVGDWGEDVATVLLRRRGCTVRPAADEKSKTHDLIVDGELVEVKTDTLARFTGKAAIELNTRDDETGEYVASGMNVTLAVRWVLVLEGIGVYAIPTTTLRRLVDAPHVNRVPTCDGRHICGLVPCVEIFPHTDDLNMPPTAKGAA